MMTTQVKENAVRPLPDAAWGSCHWFVARTRSCQERKLAGSLSELGVEVFVPVQKVKRRWSDRVKMVDKVLLPGLVFVRCSESVRRSLFDKTYGLCSFLTDRTSNSRKLLTVPPQQMADFMQVVRSLNGEEDISVVEGKIEAGDMVKVVRGPLSGFVCECVRVQGAHKLVIRLGMLGSALVEVSASDVVPRPEVSASGVVPQPKGNASDVVPRPKVSASDVVPRPEVSASDVVLRPAGVKEE